MLSASASPSWRWRDSTCTARRRGLGAQLVELQTGLRQFLKACQQVVWICSRTLDGQPAVVIRVPSNLRCGLSLSRSVSFTGVLLCSWLSNNQSVNFYVLWLATLGAHACIRMVLHNRAHLGIDIFKLWIIAERVRCGLRISGNGNNECIHGASVWFSECTVCAWVSNGRVGTVSYCTVLKNFIFVIRGKCISTVYCTALYCTDNFQVLTRPSRIYT